MVQGVPYTLSPDLPSELVFVLLALLFPVYMKQIVAIVSLYL
jgi:hypothetical protein